jgi:hypothetical protein
MKKELDKSIKEKTIALSDIGNDENDTIKELAISRVLNIRWWKEFRDYESKHYRKLKNSTIKDLKYENICLQKMINDAKKEQTLLKKAINSLGSFPD